MNKVDVDQILEADMMTSTRIPHVVEGLHPGIVDMMQDLHLMIGLGLIRCLATTTEIILQVTEAQDREMDAADQETEITEIVVDTDPQIHL